MGEKERARANKRASERAREREREREKERKRERERGNRVKKKREHRNITHSCLEKKRKKKKERKKIEMNISIYQPVHFGITPYLCIFHLSKLRVSNFTFKLHFSACVRKCMRACTWMNGCVSRYKECGNKKKVQKRRVRHGVLLSHAAWQKRKNGSRDDPDARIEEIVLPRVAGALSRVSR